MQHIYTAHKVNEMQFKKKNWFTMEDMQEKWSPGKEFMGRTVPKIKPSAE